MEQEASAAWLAGDTGLMPEGQIAREIQYFREFYGQLRPQVLLTYERQAFTPVSDHDFRLTLDENILCRRENLELSAPAGGTALLAPEVTLLELKCPGAIPLWMTELLTRLQLRKTSFSKYGQAYKTVIYPDIKGVVYHVG